VRLMIILFSLNPSLVLMVLLLLVGKENVVMESVKPMLSVALLERIHMVLIMVMQAQNTLAQAIIIMAQAVIIMAQAITVHMEVEMLMVKHIKNFVKQRKREQAEVKIFDARFFFFFFCVK